VVLFLYHPVAYKDSETIVWEILRCWHLDDGSTEQDFVTNGFKVREIREVRDFGNIMYSHITTEEIAHH